MDSKMNIKDLHEKFPMIKPVQRKMKRNDEITIGQIKAFPRQVENSSVLQLLLKEIKVRTHGEDRWKSKFKEVDKELKRLEACDRGWFENYKSLQKENEKLKLQIEELKK